jgi:hypothetical protein
MKMKHGYTKDGKISKTYLAWQYMKARCNNSKSQNYKYYGGRGITICDRWLNSFKNFLEDMGEKPKGLTLERIDNNGNYEPDNCKWATWIEQRNNTRSNRWISYNGETRTVAQWARFLGINAHLFYNKFKKQQSMEKTISALA